MKRAILVAVAAALVGAVALSAKAQVNVNVEPSVWDLTLGDHAAELPTDQFADFACGTNGGPPSRLIGAWTDFALCAPEEETGWHEVYFQYDDLLEYVALARDDLHKIALYEHTSVYSRPVIATALFDDDGFMRGLRLVTDPRVDLRTRELAYTLAGFLQGRSNEEWACEDLPPLDGETPYQGIFVKRVCIVLDAEGGVSRRIETHHYRRPGQTILNADNRPTEGYFEGVTWYEEILTNDIENRAERLLVIAALPMDEEGPVVLTARECPGCDLFGVVLRHADLRGANLAGANLEGASLHAADLTGANLEGANLRNANLNRAILTQADLAGAVLSGAMLYEARLDGADLTNATMIGVLAGHSRMIRANLSGAVVADSNLTGVRMTGAIAPNASFARSRLWNALLSRSDLTDAIFARADMLEVVMTRAVLVGADLRVTNLYGADLRDSDLTNADFTGARMTNAILARAVLEGAVFDDATLPGGFVPP